MINVFMSYRRDDAGWAGRIQNAIDRKRDIKVFRDVNDIPVGDDFPDRLQEELEKCDLVLVLIGSSWVQRAQNDDLAKNDDWIRKELLYSLGLQKPLLTLFVENNTCPTLPDELAQVSRTNAARILDRSFDPDIETLLETIQKQVQKAEQRRVTARLNGLRGVLNLAVRSLSTVKPPKEEDTRQIDQWLLPEIFVDGSDDLPPILHTMGFEPAEITYPNLRLRGVSYRAIRFKDRLRLQIGMQKQGETRPLITVYEELQEDGKTRLVITAFHEQFDMHRDRFVALTDLLKEPSALEDSEYRLPYNSLFFCPISSEKVFRQTYYPCNVRDGVDSELFAKLFEIKWIGSKPLNEPDLITFHDQLAQDFAEYEIIHAMEYPAQRRL